MTNETFGKVPGEAELPKGGKISQKWANSDSPSGIPRGSSPSIFSKINFFSKFSQIFKFLQFFSKMSGKPGDAGITWNTRLLEYYSIYNSPRVWGGGDGLGRRWGRVKSKKCIKKIIIIFNNIYIILSL